jgi:hypothetical protein
MPKASHRKYAFQQVLAGQSYGKINLLAHAQRCLLNGYAVTFIFFTLFFFLSFFLFFFLSSPLVLLSCCDSLPYLLPNVAHHEICHLRSPPLAFTERSFEFLAKSPLLYIRQRPYGGRDDESVYYLFRLWF